MVGRPVSNSTLSLQELHGAVFTPSSRARCCLLATKNEPMMREGEDLQFSNRPAPDSAGKNRNDRLQERENAGDTTTAHHKTLDLSAHLEFLVATGILESKIAGASLRSRSWQLKFRAGTSISSETTICKSTITNSRLNEPKKKWRLPSGRCNSVPVAVFSTYAAVKDGIRCFLRSTGFR